MPNIWHRIPHQLFLYSILKKSYPQMETDEMNIELSKILAKIMQSSYKRKEIGEVMERIMAKIEK